MRFFGDKKSKNSAKKNFKPLFSHILGLKKKLIILIFNKEKLIIRQYIKLQCFLRNCNVPSSN